MAKRDFIAAGSCSVGVSLLLAGCASTADPGHTGTGAAEFRNLDWQEGEIPESLIRRLDAHEEKYEELVIRIDTMGNSIATISAEEGRAVEKLRAHRDELQSRLAQVHERRAFLIELAVDLRAEWPIGDESSPKEQVVAAADRDYRTDRFPSEPIRSGEANDAPDPVDGEVDGRREREDARGPGSTGQGGFVQAASALTRAATSDLRVDRETPPNPNSAEHTHPPDSGYHVIFHADDVHHAANLRRLMSGYSIDTTVPPHDNRVVFVAEYQQSANARDRARSIARRTGHQPQVVAAGAWRGRGDSHDGAESSTAAADVPHHVDEGRAGETSLGLTRGVLTETFDIAGSVSAGEGGANPAVPSESANSTHTDVFYRFDTRAEMLAYDDYLGRLGIEDRFMAARGRSYTVFVGRFSRLEDAENRRSRLHSLTGQVPQLRETFGQEDQQSI